MTIAVLQSTGFFCGTSLNQGTSPHGEVRSVHFWRECTEVVLGDGRGRFRDGCLWSPLQLASAGFLRSGQVQFFSVTSEHWGGLRCPTQILRGRTRCPAASASSCRRFRVTNCTQGHALPGPPAPRVCARRARCFSDSAGSDEPAARRLLSVGRSSCPWFQRTQLGTVSAGRHLETP